MQFLKQTCLEELDGLSSGLKPRGHHGLNADAPAPSLASITAGAGTAEVAAAPAAAVGTPRARGVSVS